MSGRRRPSARLLRATLVVALSACGVDGGRSARVGQAPNFLLVTVDTLRADHCSAYGYSRPTTPRLERLAREGVRFDAAYAPMPATGPSHATLFTSRYPLAHGVLANGYALASGEVALAERLRESGYQTAAVTSAYPLNRKFGYDQGFDTYDQRFREEDASIPRPRWEGRPLREPYDRRADAATREAVAWLARRDPRRPFFLWVHYFDPHSPYDAPEPFRSRFTPAGEPAGEAVRLQAAYDAEIAFADAEMGRLVDALEAAGLGPTTLVVATGDHGEGLLTHGAREHGDEVYEEAVRVPFVMRWSGRIQPGQAIAAPVELLDVAPTALALLGAGAAPATFQGRSLAGLLGAARPRGADPTRPIFLQGEYDAGPSGTRYAVRAGRWKYIERRSEGALLDAEMFDLAADPAERTNVASRHPAEAARLADDVRRWRKAHGGAPASPPKLSDEDREALDALGYIE